MRLFRIGKKKEAEELAEDEWPEQPEEDEAEPEKPSRKGKKSKETSFTAGVERLNAKLEALSELRKADSERVSRISEEIGELRNLILEKEEEIKELGIKANKAAETVEELKPESIMAEARKSATKYDVLEAKIEAGNALYQKLMEELKETRKKLAVFHGMEGLMKLNEETSSNLANIKRIEANIESHSNKVGNVYVQFQKQANELIKYRDAAAALADEFGNIKKSVEEVKAKAQTALIDKKDIDKLSTELRNELNKKVQALQGTAWKQAQPKGSGSEQLILDVIRETRQRLDEKDREIESQMDELKGQLAAHVAQKRFSEQLVVDTLKEAKERLAKKDNDLKDARAELNSLKEGLYKEQRQQPRPNKEARRVENETEAEFNDRLTQLRKAVSKGSLHNAISLYNQLRESYARATTASLSEGEKYSRRSQLLEIYKELSDLAEAQQRQKQP